MPGIASSDLSMIKVIMGGLNVWNLVTIGAVEMITVAILSRTTASWQQTILNWTAIHFGALSELTTSALIPSTALTTVLIPHAW
jgi:hypothetical protein